MIHEHEREQSRLSWWWEAWPGLIAIMVITLAIGGAIQCGLWVAHLVS